MQFVPNQTEQNQPKRQTFNSPPPNFYMKKKNAFATWSFWTNRWNAPSAAYHTCRWMKKEVAGPPTFIMTVSRHLGPKPARSNRCGMRVIAFAFFSLFAYAELMIKDILRISLFPSWWRDLWAHYEVDENRFTSSSSAVDGTQFGSHYLKSTGRYQRSW